jgi:acyl carrier protein
MSHTPEDFKTIPEHATRGHAMTMAAALEWIAEMFEEPKERITPDTARSEIAAWDSLGQLILMSALDQRFDIRLSAAVLASLTSVQSILDVLVSHQRLHVR